MLLVFAVGCGSDVEELPAPPLEIPELPWEVGHHVLLAAVRWHLPNPLDTSVQRDSVVDPWTGSSLKIQTPTLSEVDPPVYTVRRMGPAEGDVLAPALMRADLTPVMVAYDFEWLPAERRFRARQLLLHELDGTPRFTYEQRGPYYVRVPVAPPAGYGTP